MCGHFLKSGFSVTNLQYFRKFYQLYLERLEIQHPLGAKSFREEPKSEIAHPTGDKSPQGFSPHLSWSHYRALMRVSKPDAREFYEHEAIACGWN